MAPRYGGRDTDCQHKRWPSSLNAGNRRSLSNQRSIHDGWCVSYRQPQPIQYATLRLRYNCDMQSPQQLESHTIRRKVSMTVLSSQCMLTILTALLYVSRLCSHYVHRCSTPRSSAATRGAVWRAAVGIAARLSQRCSLDQEHDSLGDIPAFIWHSAPTLTVPLGKNGG